MAAPAIPVRFATIKITDETDAYVEIDGVRNIPDIGSGAPDTADDTRLNSTVKQTLYGLLNPGQFNMELSRNFDDAGQEILREISVSGETRNLLITLTSGTKKYVSFDIKCGGISFGLVQANIAMVGTAAISIVGDITYASVDPDAP